jgi:hypothetical protein
MQMVARRSYLNGDINPSLTLTPFKFYHLTLPLIRLK